MAKKAANAPTPAPSPAATKPDITSPEWSDYVYTLFAEGEQTAEGHPTAAGLRRVIEIAIGPVVRSVSRVVETPNDHNMYRATAEHSVSVKFGPDDVREFGDAADVYTGNTDPEFSQHPVATACTRAESRALRKALKLQGISAEEYSTVPSSDASLDGFISKTQKNLIESLCRELSININEFIKMGEFKYNHISQVRMVSAKGMLEYLNKLYQNPALIPDAIKIPQED